MLFCNCSKQLMLLYRMAVCIVKWIVIVVYTEWDSGQDDPLDRVRLYLLAVLVLSSFKGKLCYIWPEFVFTTLKKWANNV